MPDIKVDQATARAMYDANLLSLAVLWQEINDLDDQIDEKRRAAIAAEQQLSVWAPYLDTPPQGTITEQLARLSEDAIQAARERLEADE